MKTIARLSIFVFFLNFFNMGYSENNANQTKNIQLSEEEIKSDIQKIQNNTKSDQPWILQAVKKGQVNGIGYTVKRFFPNWATDMSSFGIIAIDHGNVNYELNGIYSENIIFEQPYLTIDSYDDNGYSYLSFIDLSTGKEAVFIRNNQENGKFFLIKKLSNDAIFVTGKNLTNVQSDIPFYESVAIISKDNFTKINGYHYSYPTVKSESDNRIAYYIIGEINQDILSEATNLFENHVNEFICQVTANKSVLSQLVQNLMEDYPEKFINLSEIKCH